MTNPESIQKTIENFPQGKVFVISDFSSTSAYNNVRKVLIRLKNEGKIRRILPGIYDKPAFSEIFLQENAAPDINAVAEAIARKNNWTITPDGNTALNLLGLSTQVPANWEYLSSGDTKSYQVGNRSINFTHRADRELNGMSKKTTLVIQAIKTIGAENIAKEIIDKLAAKISAEDKQKLLIEAKPTTNWIYEVIKKICEE